MTFAVHCTKGPAGWGEHSSPHDQNVNLENGSGLLIAYTDMTKTPQSGQDSTILLHQKTRPSGNPSS